MKATLFSLILFITFGCVTDTFAQEVKDLSKSYNILSVYYNLTEDAQKHFGSINFRYGWTPKAPYTIAVQFSNPGYTSQKLKFAIEDVTSQKWIPLDSVHHTFFASEIINAGSDGLIWSGPVNNLHDEFSLCVWDKDGDAFKQSPISILSAWVKPSTNVSQKTNSPNPSTMNLPSPILANTPGIAPTPTLSQTSAPSATSLYTAIGDSFTKGTGADSPSLCYVYLTYSTLNRRYPTLLCDNDGIDSSVTHDWLHDLPDHLTQIAKKGIPLQFATILIGASSFIQVYNTNGYCKDCCKGSTLSEGVSYSYDYKNNLKQIISDFYAYNPNIKLVVVTCPDFTNGSGKFAPKGVFEAYRQRIFELRSQFPKMRIADAWKAMEGHPEYFYHPKPDDIHPNNLGHAFIAKLILEQFSNWK